VMADYGLGDLLFRRGQLEESAQLVANALAAQKILFGEANANVAGTLDTLARIYQEQGKWEIAEQTAREALTITEKAFGNTNSNTAYYHSALADLLIKRRKFVEAEKSAQAALAIFQSDTSADHQYLASAEYLLAEVLVATGRSKEAEPLLRANIERWQKADAPAWRAARSRNLLGAALLQLRKQGEGTALLQESYGTLSAADSGAPADVVVTAKSRLASAAL